ncbi:PorP/SprF family type IX secretion system membrane protein [Daejeonella sp.]|jgi:type IX secretion system PorP/SprF family membrane protein|uniref:PorP/SprF family type IX secretion system membrane protein n=1 Tax=Daejeonella sp. TaxID=2805397 RepID=UPI0037C06BF2
MNAYSFNFYFATRLSLLVAIILVSQLSYGQLRPIYAQYFQNPYFVNPAFAGEAKGLDLNMVYSVNANNAQGGASVRSDFQAVSASVKAGKSGFGIIFQNDRAGLLSSKQIKFTYAYHVQLNEKSNLRFGLSPGFSNIRVDIESAMITDLDDPFPMEFNNRKSNFDVDFGTALTSERFTLQVALPNLNQLIGDSENEGFNQLAYLAANYRIKLSSQDNGLNLQPMIAYTKIQNTKSRVDIGAKINLVDDAVGFLGLYHSDKSFSTGLNVNLKQGFILQAIYHSSSAVFERVQRDAIEFGLKTNLSKK